MKICFALAVVVLASGCASNSGIVPMGQGTYMVSRQDNNFTASVGLLKASNLKDASAFCADKGRDFAVVDSTDVPRALGKVPQSTIHFRCIAKES